MTNPEFILALAGIAGGTLFSMTPVFIVRTVLAHREKMASLKFSSEGSPALLEEIKRLRSDVSELRETTTRFDISFDAALARVEDRLTDVEQKQTPARYNANAEYAPSQERIEVGQRR